MRKSGAKRKHISIMSLRNRFIGLTKQQKLDLGLAYHAGLFRIEHGIGTDEDWGTMAVCIRIGMQFALTGNGAEDATALIAAHDAVMACEERFKRKGKYLLTCDEMQLVRAGLTAHDKQMNRTSYHTVSKLLIRMEVELQLGQMMGREAA